MFKFLAAAALAALAGPALSATLMTATFEGVVTADRASHAQTDAAGKTVTVEEEGGLAAGTAFVATFTYLAEAAGCSVDPTLCDEYEPQVHYTHALASAVIPILGFEEFNEHDLRHNGVFTRRSEEDPAGRTFGLEQNAYVSSFGEAGSFSEDWIRYGFGGLVYAPSLAVDLTAPFSQVVDHARSPWAAGYFSHDQSSLLTGTGEGWRRERETEFRIDRFSVAPSQAAIAALPAPVPLPASVLLLGGGIGIMALKRARR